MAAKELQETCDRFAIESVLIDYALACDRRDWSMLDDVFLPDVTADYAGEYRVDSRKQLVAMIRSMLGGCGPTQHMLGNFRVEIGGDTATAACYIRAVHAGSGQRTDLTYEIWGEYRDRLVRTADGWRIAARELEVFRETGTRDVLAAG